MKYITLIEKFSDSQENSPDKKYIRSICRFSNTKPDMKKKWGKDNSEIQDVRHHVAIKMIGLCVLCQVKFFGAFFFG